jgi:hypothetical protein
MRSLLIPSYSPHFKQVTLTWDILYTDNSPFKKMNDNNIDSENPTHPELASVNNIAFLMLVRYNVIQVHQL